MTRRNGARLTVLALLLSTCVPLIGSTTSPAQAGDADPAPLAFSATTPADPQRDEGEPNIEIARDGKIYTCGPTGFLTDADYMQVSTDGGDSFHLLGQPPRGQLAPGGGGDCGLATSPTKNAEGQYTLAYTGLANTDFSTATSMDAGRTWASTASSVSGVTDRQWMVFTDDHTVLLSYNDIQPRNVVVQKSTDGGLTYGTKVTAAPNPLFPGPMRADYDVSHNVGGSGPLVYFAWNRASNVYLSVSKDQGTSWKQCLVSTTNGDPSAGFTTVDHDTAGNLYVSWTEKGAGTNANTLFQTYLSTLTVDKIASCATLGVNPGFAPKTRVDQAPLGTTLFPWLAAGGAPGRVAITYYGTESNGNPNVGTFKATWDVYVAQSLDALSPTPTFTQVKATTHPFHYDSICLDGLTCTGDRSLADFYAMGFDPTTGRLVIVYAQGGKKPDDKEGYVAIPAVLHQVSGPSNAGGLVTPDPRPVVRSTATDPVGDALAPYSSSALTPVRAPAPSTANRAALDVESVTVGAELNPATGAVVPAGGFTVRIKVTDLSAAALQAAATGTASGSLIWAFHFIDGFQAAAASAHWDPVRGFGFGYDDYSTAFAQCLGTPSTGNPTGVPEKCLTYGGKTSIEGAVNVPAGTITLSVPRSLLHGLAGSTGPNQRPTEVPAALGTRFYDGTVFTLGNPAPDPATQGYLTPVDATPSFDFLLTDDQGAFIPEAPLTLLLPVVGLLMLAIVARRRRRRTLAG
jgi:hypothetical protein